jgi:hypothetical protein
VPKQLVGPVDEMNVQARTRPNSIRVLVAPKLGSDAAERGRIQPVGKPRLSNLV